MFKILFVCMSVVFFISVASPFYGVQACEEHKNISSTSKSDKMTTPINAEKQELPRQK